MTDLERKFHEDMINIYKVANKELGYKPTRFLQLVSEKGGLKAAKILISKQGGTYGFEVLSEYNRLDLSVENYVLKAEYKELFTEDERKICKERIDEFKKK